MAKFKVGDKVKYHGRKAVVTEVHHDGESDYLLDVEGAGSGWYADEDEVTAANSAVRSTNATVRNALAAQNAGIWESAKEAEDRSDVFVRAALGRTKYNFDTEAGTLREVIKLLASAEQTPKIKKNTEKLKGILSRVEKAAALFKGI